MKTRYVQEILLPFPGDIPLSPRVGADERITRAIEVMLENGTQQIAVFRRDRVVGIVRLKDAFHLLGLKMPGR